MIKNQNDMDTLAKSNYIFELLKQYVSLKEILRRNSLKRDTFQVSDEYKKLPFFLVKF